ncbi:MAG: hypothetical protein C4567_12430 [Deltaproteobacteria bacterium]|nr:MAG: hypothetical protein C4567_12430 [Deltaproteobacteria bacterium]
MPEVKLTVIVDEQGAVKITGITGDLERLKNAAASSGEALDRAGKAAAAGGRGVAQSGKDASQAGTDYERLGQSVALAQAKMVALYAVVRGSYSLFDGAMERVDAYEKAIIRMAAAEADLSGKTGKDLEAHYESLKAKYGELVDYAMVASSKYFANAREMMMVMEWAIARNQSVSKSTIDNIGLFIDKIKQLVPWIKQEGQVLQELNALWEGHARMTDTMAKLVIDRLKQMGQISATEGKEVQKQFQNILAEWKKEGFGGFLEKVMGLFPAAAVASKDIQQTWESTKETLGTVADKLAQVAFKPIYKDVIAELDKVKEYYLTGNQALEHQQDLAKRVGDAWKDTKQFLGDLKPIIAGVWELLKQMDDGRRTLPVEVQEIGIVGFFLVGTKGKVAILAILNIIGQVKTSLEGLKAWSEGNLSFWDYMTSGADELRQKLDKLRESQEKLKREGVIQPLPEGLPPEAQWMMNQWGPMLTPQSGEWRSGGGEEWGFWGGLSPAADYGRGRTVFDPRSGLKDLVREHKGSYDEIQRYRQDLDQQYYQGAVEHARSMSQQVGGFYAGMADAAARYHAESTNLYKQGVKAFAGFTQASEGLLMGFFDIIIWRTGKFTDVMTNFLKRLSNALLESLVVQPLVGLIAGGVGSLFKGAGSYIFGEGGGWLGNLLGLGGGGQTGIINSALNAPATGNWPQNYGGGYGGGGSGDGAWLGLLGVGGIGLLAAMMSGNEKNAGGAGGSTETMSVQTMQVAQLVVQGMVSGQSGGAYLANPATAQEIAKAQIQAGSYQFLFQGTGQAQEVESLVAAALYVQTANIAGLEGLEGILERAGSAWQDQVLQSGDLLEDASRVFVDNVSKGGMSFKESMESMGRSFMANWQTLAAAVIRDLRGPVETGGGISGILGFLDLGIFHGGGVLGKDEHLYIGQEEEGLLGRPIMRKLGRRNFEALRTGNFDQVDFGAQAGKPGPPDARPEMHMHFHIHALDAESVSPLDWERMVENKIAPVLKKYQGQWID